MDYTQITECQTRDMLRTIGVDSVDDLFAGIPKSLRVDGLLNIPKGISEPELFAELDRLANSNRPAHRDDYACFLGAGVYDHFIPTVVDAMATQGEFVTAYTPYQAEASQGSLQAFYEFQTMLCQLTGMDVANASLYEQASAVAEAILMAGAVTGKRRVLTSRTLHPDAIHVLRTLTYEQPVKPVRLPHRDGLLDLDALKSELNDQTAAVVIQSPNFLGNIEPVADIANITHDAGALLIQSVDPISCGILKRPGDMGVDIVVGEGQPLGIPMSYGGPFLGLFACREPFLRKMPGRIVGMTSDAEGKRGFCLTLQAREQHIKRQRATSNVCTNQGLLALRASIYMAAMGKSGIQTVARRCMDKAHYLAERIDALDEFNLKFKAPFFREFVVQSNRPVEAVLSHCRDRGILAGVPLAPWHEDLTDCFMVAVTEKRTRQQLDDLVSALQYAPQSKQAPSETGQAPSETGQAPSETNGR
jgi:glycine dehydrogenase subunit 1